MAFTAVNNKIKVNSDNVAWGSVELPEKYQKSSIFRLIHYGYGMIWRQYENNTDYIQLFWCPFCKNETNKDWCVYVNTTKDEVITGSLYADTGFGCHSCQKYCDLVKLREKLYNFYGKPSPKYFELEKLYNPPSIYPGKLTDSYNYDSPMLAWNPADAVAPPPQPPQKINWPKLPPVSKKNIAFGMAYGANTANLAKDELSKEVAKEPQMYHILYMDRGRTYNYIVISSSKEECKTKLHNYLRNQYGKEWANMVINTCSINRVEKSTLEITSD